MAAEKFHTEAPEDVYDLLEKVIGKHHSDLSDSQFLILFKHGGWKSKKRPVLGKFKVLGDDLRSTYDKDAILYLNADLWNQMAAPQRLYVLDQALYSLSLKYDRHDNVKEAADGRPLLGTVAPDIEAFADVIRRHGPIMEDIKRLASALKETNGQLTIDDAAAEAQHSPPAEPREGIKVTVDQNGLVDVYDDKNQLTLEQAAATTDDDVGPSKSSMGLMLCDDDPMAGVADGDPAELED